jgi:hypothetical protein
MAKNVPIQSASQILMSHCLLTFVCLGFVFTWILFFLREPQERKRPGINIKEF